MPSAVFDLLLSLFALEQDFDDPFAAALEVPGVQGPSPQGEEQRDAVEEHAGHDHVIAGPDGADGAGHAGGRAGPVGHDDAVKAALAAQVVLEQGLVDDVVDAVHRVIARHDGTGTAVTDGAFEGTQVDLTQGPLREVARRLVALELLVVGAEVFDGRIVAGTGCDTLADRCGDGPRHHRVFTVIFEVAAAQRVTVDVHARRQPEGDTVLGHLGRDRGAECLREVDVPGLGHSRSHRERGGVLVQDRAEFFFTEAMPFSQAPIVV